MKKKKKNERTHLFGSNCLCVSSELELYSSGSTVCCRRWSLLQDARSCSCPAGVCKKALNQIGQQRDLKK